MLTNANTQTNNDDGKNINKAPNCHKRSLATSFEESPYRNMLTIRKYGQRTKQPENAQGYSLDAPQRTSARSQDNPPATPFPTNATKPMKRHFTIHRTKYTVTRKGSELEDNTQKCDDKGALAAQDKRITSVQPNRTVRVKRSCPNLELSVPAARGQRVAILVHAQTRYSVFMASELHGDLSSRSKNVPSVARVVVVACEQHSSR